MPLEVTRTTTSVGSSMRGSGTVSMRTSRLPCQESAFMPVAVPTRPGIKRFRRPEPGPRPVMRVVVVGATGNIGSSLVDSLRAEPRVTSIVGVARRAPQPSLPDVEFRVADIVRDSLEPIFGGADAVV